MQIRKDKSKGLTIHNVNTTIKLLFVVAIIAVIAVGVFVSGNQDNSSSEREISSITDSDFQELHNLSQEEPEPTTFGLIETAYREGAITLDKALRLKTVATFDYTQLPKEFNAGSPARLQGDMILVEVKEHWDDLNSETQVLFEPMFLDPSENGSFFHPAHIDVRKDVISKLLK
jgi:hypothetical protein